MMILGEGHAGPAEYIYDFMYMLVREDHEGPAKYIYEFMYIVCNRTITWD